jgi:NAD(P)-dependent dehydrogenase (short-subunit alcohol dehydrogenase family)
MHVLITGCSSGIGLAAAVQFARRGATVAATMRNLDRAGPLRSALTAAGAAADLWALDVADDESVAAAVAAITAGHGVPDVVISNAGVGYDGTTEEMSIAEFRTAFETNTLGSVRLLHAVLPEWRRRGDGRFIAVSSVAGVVGQPFNDVYCMSKFALEGMLESLAPVVATHGIKVSVVEPGPVAGDFATRTPAPSGRTGSSPYAAARERFQSVQDEGYSVAQTNEQIAEVLWEVASSEAPLLRYQTSDPVARLIGKKLKDMTGERVLALTSAWV